LSLHICDCGNKVDGTSSNNKSWLGGKSSGGSSFDVLRSDLVDLISILVEGKVSIGEEVLGNFLKSILLFLEVGEDLHSELGLSSSEFFIANSISQVG